MAPLVTGAIGAHAVDVATDMSSKEVRTKNFHAERPLQSQVEK
jgi:hypothetical protein